MLSLEIVNELRALSIGNDEFIQQLYTVFLDTLTERLSELERAIVLHDSDKVTRLSHGLKSSCFNLGAQKMGELCQELELFGRQKSLNKAFSVFHQLASEAEFIIQEIIALPELKKTK